MAQMKFMHDQMEQERDYYFNKLRDVEILCQNEHVKDDALSKAVLKILYSVDSDSKHVLKEVRNDSKTMLLATSSSMQYFGESAVFSYSVLRIGIMCRQKL